MKTTFLDWTEYFSALSSSAIIDKSCLKSLFKNFDADISKEDALIQVEKHDKTVFLARLSLRSGINIFHHFIQVGGQYIQERRMQDFLLG